MVETTVGPAAPGPQGGPGLEALAHVGDVLLRYDEDLVIVWASASLERVLGYRVEDVVGTKLRFTAEDDRAATLAEYERAAADGTDVLRSRRRLVRADGAVRWFETVTRILRDDTGRVVSTIASMRDVHEQVETERRYRLLAENSADVVLLLDRDDRVVWVAPSITRTWGYEAADLLGELQPGLLHSADVESVAREMHWLRTGMVTETTLDVRVLHADGRYRWWAVRAARVDETGEARDAQIVLAFRDVDEAVRARRDAILEHERWVAAIDAMREPYVLLETVPDRTGTVADLRFVDANPSACEYFGRRVQELVGTSVLDAFARSVAEPLFAALRRTATTGEPLALDSFPLAAAGRGDGTQPSSVDVLAVRVGDGVSCTWRTCS